MQNGSISELYRKAALILVNMKSMNRNIYGNLESKRKEVDAKRENVDRLLLFYENLKYKQSYLRRQISVCKDLSTPQLNLIEKETNQIIAAREFNSISQLQSQHDNAIKILNEEAHQRKEMQSTVYHLEIKHHRALEQLDKKRKFLDDLPTRVAAIKASTTDLSAQFAAVMQEP